jgi:outer membrane protein
MRQIVKILILMLLYSSSFGQSKTGFVDYERIVQSVPDYSAERNAIENTKALYQDTLKILMADFQLFLEKSIPHNIKMDSLEMLDLENAIKEMEIKVRNYKLTAQTQIARVQEEIERGIKDKVAQALNKFCSVKGIISMAEKDAILFCSNCKDYTEDFISYLKNATTR